MQRKIFRYPPKSLYRQCIIDWFVIRPVEIILAGALGLDSAVEDLRFRLFPGVYHPFTSDVFSKCLKRDSLLHLGQGIGLSDFRTLQSNIVSKHRDPAAIKIEHVEHVADLQQGHSSGMAESVYALMPDRPQGVSENTIDAYHRASHWWQHLTGTWDPVSLVHMLTLFSGIQPLESPPARNQTATGDSVGSVCTAPASLSGLESRMDRLSNQMESLNINIRSAVDDSVGSALAIQARRGSNVDCSSEPERELFVPHPSLNRMLRKFLGNSTAKFKTPEQAEAIEFVMAHQRHLLLVGPTAMGKTLAYMLPASQREYGITCVLLPLSALHPDFDRRCKEIKIESSRWTPVDDRPATKIVYVSPEHAQTKQFVDWLIKSRNRGLLKQFVVDEAHLVIGHKAFRFCFLALKPLVSCGTFENQTY